MSIEIVRSAVAAVSPMLQAMEARIIARLELLEQRGAAAIGRIGSQPVQPDEDEDEDEDENDLQEQLVAARESYEETNLAAINAAALADDLNAKLQAARAARYARLNRR